VFHAFLSFTNSLSRLAFSFNRGDQQVHQDILVYNVVPFLEQLITRDATSYLGLRSMMAIAILSQYQPQPNVRQALECIPDEAVQNFPVFLDQVCSIRDSSSDARIVLIGSFFKIACVFLFSIDYQLRRNELVYNMMWDITEPLHPLSFIVRCPRMRTLLCTRRLIHTLLDIILQDREKLWACSLSFTSLCYLTDDPAFSSSHITTYMHSISTTELETSSSALIQRCRELKYTCDSNVKRQASRILLIVSDRAKWNAFLMGMHVRLGTDSPVREFPKDLLPLLLSYL
jgi:hypothetical protein